MQISGYPGDTQLTELRTSRLKVGCVLHSFPPVGVQCAERGAIRSLHLKSTMIIDMQWSAAMPFLRVSASQVLNPRLVGFIPAFSFVLRPNTMCCMYCEFNRTLQRLPDKSHVMVVGAVLECNVQYLNFPSDLFWNWLFFAFFRLTRRVFKPATALSCWSNAQIPNCTVAVAWKYSGRFRLGYICFIWQQKINVCVQPDLSIMEVR